MIPLDKINQETRLPDKSGQMLLLKTNSGTDRLIKDIKHSTNLQKPALPIGVNSNIS